MRKDVLLVIVLAMVCRLLVYACALNYDRNDRPTRFAFTNPDALTYDQLALNLAQYGVYSESADPHALAPAAERGPGYPAFIALVYRVLGHQPQAAILLQIILSALTAGIVCIIGYSLGGRVAGLASGLLLAIDLPSIIYANLLLTETLSALIILITVWLLLLGWQASGMRHMFLLLATGVMAGIAAYVRTASVLWPAVLVGCNAIYSRQASRSLKGAAYIVVGFVVVLTPWVVRNNVIFGEPGFSSGAGNCLLYFNAGVVMSAKQGLRTSDAVSPPERQAAARLAGTPDAAFADSRIKTDMALNILRDNKALTARLFVKCFVRTLLGPSRGYLTELFPYPGLVAVLSGALGAFCFVLAIWGVQIMVHRPEQRALAFLIALSLVYAGAVAFLQGYSRFRIPYIPLLTLAAGMGIHSICSVVTGRNRPLQYGTTCATEPGQE